MPPETTSDTREKILDVAEALFARRGYAGVGLRAVAEAVGLGKSSLFHHFRNKTDLYLAVMRRVLARIEERLPPAVRSDDPAAQLDRWIDVLIDTLAEHPPSARLLLRGLFEDEDLPAEAQETAEARAVEATIAGVLDGGGRLLRAGIERGVFRPVSVPHTLQTVIGATVYHFASGEFGEELTGQPLLSAEAVRARKEEVRAFVRGGLLAPGARAT